MDFCVKWLMHYILCRQGHKIEQYMMWSMTSKSKYILMELSNTDSVHEQRGNKTWTFCSFSHSESREMSYTHNTTCTMHLFTKCWVILMLNCQSGLQTRRLLQWRKADWNSSFALAAANLSLFTILLTLPMKLFNETALGKETLIFRKVKRMQRCVCGPSSTWACSSCTGSSHLRVWCVVTPVLGSRCGAFITVCFCACVLCVLPPQTRCLISLGWVTWRWTPGRTPHSSVSPRERFRRQSPSCWRWGRETVHVGVLCFLY